MKAKKSLLIVLTAIMMFAMTGCGSKLGSTLTAKIDKTTPDTAFEALEVERVGSHIFIEKDFCEKRMRESEKKEIMAALAEADKGIDTDVYVYGISESYDKSGYSLVADAYVKGVDVTDAKVRCQCEGGIYTWKSFSGGNYVKSEIDIDTSNVIPAEKIYSKVFDLAKEHEKDMMGFVQEDFQIRGEYTLWYTEGRGLYYFFTINENSSVQVNATTGEITEYYFWNGFIVD